MITKNFSEYIRALFCMPFAALLLLGTLSSDAAGTENPKKNANTQNDIQLVGLISPDGTTNLWPIAKARGGKIRGLLANYPSKFMEGIKFYKLSSWQGMAKILMAVNEQQSQVIRHMAQDVQKLNKRVRILEKKRKWVVYTGSLNHRVQALEEKVEYMSDGGYP